MLMDEFFVVVEDVVVEVLFVIVDIVVIVVCECDVCNGFWLVMCVLLGFLVSFFCKLCWFFDMVVGG